MREVRDDPIIRAIMNTGYPPKWMEGYEDDEDDWEEEDPDVFYGNSSEDF